MKDELFLSYANNLFKDDPKNLKLVIQNFLEQQWTIAKARGLDGKLHQVRLEIMVEDIGIYSDCKDFDSALKIKDKLKSKTQQMEEKRGVYIDKNDINVAFEAVFYQRYGFCHGTWTENGSCLGYRSDQHESGIGDNFRIKCHECCQQFFRSMLLDLVKNNDFHQIVIKKEDNFGLMNEEWFNENLPGVNQVSITDDDNRNSFDYYLSRAYDCVEIRACVENNNIIKYEYFAETNLYDNQRSIYPLHKRFNEYLTSVVSYSLIEFLRKNTNKKLKICPYCNNFFIAKDIKRKRGCYSKLCEKAYQREKKRKQRENDPVKYH